MNIEELLEEALVPGEEQLHEIPENWVWVKLNYLSKVISKGTTPPKSKGHDYTDEGVNFLRVENITKNYNVDISNVKFIGENTHLGVLSRSIGEEDDMLVSIAGTLGRVAVIKKEHLPCNMNQAIAFVRLFNQYVDSNYIKYAISSPIIRKRLLGQQKITAQPNLTLKNIGDTLIPLAPINEQKRIVEKVERLLNKIERVKQLIKTDMENLEILKQSILSKAFRGELGTNDPSEENAIELLKEILQEQVK